MAWKASKSHQSKSFGGKTHFDVYHTNDAGKRDQDHKTDVKISGEPREPSMKDIHTSSEK